MMPLKLLVLIVLTPALFAGKTLTMKCGSCDGNMDCPTPFCFTYTGQRDFKQKCTGINGCPIDQPLDVNIFTCNIDIRGKMCRPKICYNFANKKIWKPADGSPVNCDQMWTQTVFKCGAHCESCGSDKCLEMNHSVSQVSKEEEIVQKKCMKDFCENDQGYGLMSREACRNGVDSFGYPRNCCDSYYELATDFGLCLGQTEVFDDNDLQRALGRWLGIRGRTFDCSVCNAEKLTDRLKRICGLNACP